MTTPKFDNLAEVEIYANPPLQAYLSRVHKRHGYVRLLGLRDLVGRPDVPIEVIFVPPLLAQRSIAVDTDPRSWKQCETIYAALERHRRLLLLGDPGTGKTTLFDYLVWLLTFAQRRTPFTKRFGWMLPVPMVLRELTLGSIDTFDDLLDAFLRQPVAEPLKDGVYLRQMLSEGRALLALDGIDELGSKDARQRLRDAVFDGMRRFPDCLWLLSSRIVGYSEAPFENTHRTRLGPNGAIADPGPLADAHGIGKRYIAPFDDRRIQRFVHNWYHQRNSRAVKEGKHIDLLKAIRKDPALRHLARVPNILALMALVHRIDATLPQERWLLYDRIADAYLGTIDKHRNMGDGANDLSHKKMWLARVGFEMQCRREEAADMDILVPCADALHWIGSEMERSKAPAAAPTAEEFLSFVGRRSGLFVPKGDDLYAFRHLSFQEYFAAAALATEVTGFSWAKNGRSSLGFTQTDLATWARQQSWLETFCFLFEMLADKPEWHSELATCVFGEGFSYLQELEVNDEVFHLAHLAARLAVNPHSGLGPHDRTLAIEGCVRTQIRCSDYHFRTRKYAVDFSLFGLLMAKDSDLCGTVMALIPKLWLQTMDSLELRVLDLRRANIVDLPLIAELPNLDILILADTDVDDVQCLTRLDELAFLDLDGTAVSDLTPLGEMPQIKFLSIERTKIEDITPLERVNKLKVLLWAGTPISAQAIAALQEALPSCKIIKNF